MRLILQLFDAPDTTFRGSHFDVPVPVTVLPRPIQRPRPPIWMAASSPSSIRFAAAYGFHFMAPTTLTAPELVVRREYIEACLHESGSTGQGWESEANRFVYCGTDEEEIRQAIRASALQTNVSKVLLQGHTPAGGINPVDYGAIDVESAVRDRFLIGNADQIVTQLEVLADAGISYIQGLFRYGDLPAALARRSLERFAAEVLPRIGAIQPRALVSPEPAQVTG